MSVSLAELDCHFRQSRRAKRMILQIHPVRGLEVVLPIGVSRRQGERFLRKNLSWVLQRLPKQCLINRPASVSLRYLDKIYDIDYQDFPGKKSISVIETDQKLVVWGDAFRDEDCFMALSCYVKRLALKVFSRDLLQLAKTLGFKIGRIGVRSQQTRWGSCNQSGDIQLNYKLMFLPSMLVNYVMIHELCHTIHMNHSAQFWLLVEKYDEDFLAHRKALKEADQFIPVWAT